MLGLCLVPWMEGMNHSYSECAVMHTLSASVIPTLAFALGPGRRWGCLEKSLLRNWGVPCRQNTCLTCIKSWIQFLAPHTPGVMAYAWSPSIGVEAGGSEVHSHPQLHSKC